MHLSFNTLPYYKKWIIGCQCDFCLNYSNEKFKINQYETLLNDLDYFNDTIPYSSQNINNYLVCHNYNILYKNYDPLCGSVYEMNNTYNSIKNK